MASPPRKRRPPRNLRKRASGSRKQQKAGFHIPLHHIVDIVGEIHRLGHADQFKAAAQAAAKAQKEKKNRTVTVPVPMAKFVKKYMATNNLHAHSKIAANVVGACPGPDPYNCPYEDK